MTGLQSGGASATIWWRFRANRRCPHFRRIGGYFLACARLRPHRGAQRRTCGDYQGDCESLFRGLLPPSSDKKRTLRSASSARTERSLSRLFSSFESCHASRKPQRKASCESVPAMAASSSMIRSTSFRSGLSNRSILASL